MIQSLQFVEHVNQPAMCAEQELLTGAEILLLLDQLRSFAQTQPSPFAGEKVGRTGDANADAERNRSEIGRGIIPGCFVVRSNVFTGSGTEPCCFDADAFDLSVFSGNATTKEGVAVKNAPMEDRNTHCCEMDAPEEVRTVSLGERPRQQALRAIAFEQHEV